MDPIELNSVILTMYRLLSAASITPYYFSAPPSFNSPYKPGITGFPGTGNAFRKPCCMLIIMVSVASPGHFSPSYVPRPFGTFHPRHKRIVELPQVVQLRTNHAFHD